MDFIPKLMQTVIARTDVPFHKMVFSNPVKKKNNCNPP